MTGNKFEVLNQEEWTEVPNQQQKNKETTIISMTGTTKVKDKEKTPTRRWVDEIFGEQSEESNKPMEDKESRESTNRKRQWERESARNWILRERTSTQNSFERLIDLKKKKQVGIYCPFGTI
ncbi:hypothetical protein H5410_060661 [Solanum commersonii]|uniref:Uncharacterized protein n=1 Tax=Solanum commersonii TaxID=4109 RepID=A0A9J5W6B2_SOLCO|nr:hypothetical protein H5410_060661 [Solanum commersonii]